MRKSGTERAMEATASAVKGYVLGAQTQEHIALFVEGLAETSSISAKCLVEAVAVAETFPEWERNSEAYKALGKGVIEALKAAGMKEGSAKGYATHFSNIVRCAKLGKVEYSAGKTKDGKPILKSCSGKDFFLKHCGSFAEAYHAAKVITKNYGLTNGKGPRPKSNKVMGKAEVIDALDKVIAATRVLPDFDSSFLDCLLKARTIATGKTTAVNVVRAERIKGYAKLSRGQKAAATRRANKTKQDRAVEQARLTPVNAPVATTFH